MKNQPMYHLAGRSKRSAPNPKENNSPDFWAVTLLHSIDDNDNDNDYLFFLLSQMHHFYNEKNPATILN